MTSVVFFARYKLMLTKGQLIHFETFGFLVLRQAFSAAEMKAFTDAAEEIWAVEKGESTGRGENRGSTSVGEFVERQTKLTSLAEDDRIYGVIEQLLGPGFIWAGSEGQRGRISTTWHNDHPGETQKKYTRIKVILYLEPTTKETGALRVISGSHRSPYHDSLELLQEYHMQHNEVSNSREGKTKGHITLPFGVESPDIPCYTFESNPGDVIFFHQNLYHAVYGGLGERRRYIAMKFGAKPTTDEHVRLIKDRTEYVFHPHEAFLNSSRPRIRSMVENLETIGAKV